MTLRIRERVAGLAAERGVFSDIDDAEQPHLLGRHVAAVVRVLTTTYVGATEARAVDRLVELGAEVRISYEVLRTRLHAKAWLFTRDSGLDTAYVGSSNLSRAAMVDGLEWNVRVSRAENPAVLTKFASTFEAYWLDPSFDPNPQPPAPSLLYESGSLSAMRTSATAGMRRQ